MELKQYLLKYLSQNKQDLSKVLKNTNKSLKELDKLNLGDAVYSVQLISMWETEGGKSVHVEQKGNLEDAIKEAEGQFKEVNHRSDVQANYQVMVLVGKTYCSVPQEYWKEFSGKKR